MHATNGTGRSTCADARREKGETCRIQETERYMHISFKGEYTCTEGKYTESTNEGAVHAQMLKGRAVCMLQEKGMCAEACNSFSFSNFESRLARVHRGFFSMQRGTKCSVPGPFLNQGGLPTSSTFWGKLLGFTYLFREGSFSYLFCFCRGNS